MKTSNTVVGNQTNVNKEYHGIIINISQRDKSIFKTIDILGKRKYLFGLLIFYKIKVVPENLVSVIKTLQNNLSNRILFKKQEFYFHFYRDNELIIVFRDKIFKVSPDKSTWLEAITHGRQLKITDKQLDFIPNRFEDETY